MTAANLIFISLLLAVFGAFTGILLARTLGMNSYFFLPWLVPLLGGSLAVIVGMGVYSGCLGLASGWIFTDSHMILGHLSLRFLLASSSRAPLNLVRFLDICDERLILRKAGGSYVFFHRLLLDYFAALPVLSMDCRLDHAAEEIAARKRRLLVPINRAGQHYNLARAFLLQGSLPQASHHFRVNLGLRPKDGLGPNVHLGVLSWQTGQAELARQAFEAALRVYDSSKRSGIYYTGSAWNSAPVPCWGWAGWRRPNPPCARRLPVGRPTIACPWMKCGDSFSLASIPPKASNG